MIPVYPDLCRMAKVSVVLCVVLYTLISLIFCVPPELMLFKIGFIIAIVSFFGFTLKNTDGNRRFFASEDIWSIYRILMDVGKVRSVDWEKNHISLFWKYARHFSVYSSIRIVRTPEETASPLNS
jgi:hypothetical protein